MNLHSFFSDLFANDWFPRLSAIAPYLDSFIFKESSSASSLVVKNSDLDLSHFANFVDNSFNSFNSINNFFFYLQGEIHYPFFKSGAFSPIYRFDLLQFSLDKLPNSAFSFSQKKNVFSNFKVSDLPYFHQANSWIKQTIAFFNNKINLNSVRFKLDVFDSKSLSSIHSFSSHDWDTRSIAYFLELLALKFPSSNFDISFSVFEPLSKPFTFSDFASPFSLINDSSKINSLFPNSIRF